MPGEEISPHHDVPVLYIREPGINVLLSFVRLGGRENPVEVSGIGFVLPVVLEGMNVRGWGCGHWSNLNAQW